MEGINVVMPQEDMVISEIDRAELKASRSRKRVFELLQKASQSTAARSDMPIHVIKICIAKNSMLHSNETLCRKPLKS